MRVIIFGATGGTGRQLLTRALKAGHQVCAFSRDPDQNELSRPDLEWVHADVMDQTAVNKAVKGMDAVFCTLGQGPGSKKRVRTLGIKNIIKAMESHAVKTLIAVSALGVADSASLLPLHYKYLIVPLLLAKVFADHEGQEKLIKASNLNWVIIRPSELHDGPAMGNYHHGFEDKPAELKLKVSREDVADFLLQQLHDRQYQRLTPAISD